MLVSDMGSCGYRGRRDCIILQYNLDWSERKEKLSKEIMRFCSLFVLFLFFFFLIYVYWIYYRFYICVYIITFIVGVKFDSWIYIFWLIGHFTPFRITIYLYEHMNKLSLYNASLLIFEHEQDVFSLSLSLYVYIYFSKTSKLNFFKYKLKSSLRLFLFLF